MSRFSTLRSRSDREATRWGAIDYLSSLRFDRKSAICLSWVPFFVILCAMRRYFCDKIQRISGSEIGSRRTLSDLRRELAFFFLELGAMMRIVAQRAFIFRYSCFMNCWICCKSERALCWASLFLDRIEFCSTSAQRRIMGFSPRLERSNAIGAVFAECCNLCTSTSTPLQGKIWRCSAPGIDALRDRRK